MEVNYTSSHSFSIFLNSIKITIYCSLLFLVQYAALLLSVYFICGVPQNYHFHSHSQYLQGAPSQWP
jgi:hypothetical protein